MATFDQLAADQRAIIEIVLKQGKSYEEIGEMLDLPPARARELARDALGELAPFTAEFVDSQWRGQLADYVLGQQTGPESQATRGHLRRSEPARIWAYSLLDALDDFYGDGDRPEIPPGEVGSGLRARTIPQAPNGEPPAAPAAPAATGGLRGATGLSSAARTALMRRRILGAVIGVVVVGLLVFGAIELFGGGGGGGGGEKKTAASTPTSTSPTSGAQGAIVAQAALSPVGGFKGQGAAIVYQNGNQYYLVIRAKFPPSTKGHKYLIWLYNSDKQLAPVAGDGTDKNGNFQGAQVLGNGWQNYKFVDITYQSTNVKKLTHGRSVMRGPLLAAQQSGGSTGTTTTP